MSIERERSLELWASGNSMTHKFFWRKILDFLNIPPPHSDVMKGRQLTDVSRRRFDVLQSPVQLQGSPDFRKAPRFILSPLLLLLPRSPSFRLLRSHPFSSVNEPVERKGERVVEQRESKLRPTTFSFLSLSLSLFSCFFPPLSLFFSFLPLPLLPSDNANFSPQSEK